jgi:hypothetical protein
MKLDLSLVFQASFVSLKHPTSPRSPEVGSEFVSHYSSQASGRKVLLEKFPSKRLRISEMALGDRESPGIKSVADALVA